MRHKAAIWSTGLAMFSMFFGAGNIVFPLALGQFTGDQTFYGILGLVVTAILVPLTGLLAMLLYEGDYYSFFHRIGKLPGFFVIFAILGLIGPFGGIPRCITISHSTLMACGLGETAFKLPIFSLFSCAIIFLFTFRPNKILSMLGYVLTPILLVALGTLAIRGLYVMPQAAEAMHTKWEIFSHGFFDGYNTMDLLAAFFFSSAVLLCLRRSGLQEQEPKRLFKIAMYASFIAALLLALIYVSFSYLAAGFQGQLAAVPDHQLLGALAYQLLGPQAGLIAGVIVTFACLTTEIALTAVFADFLSKKLFRDKISHRTALFVTLGCSFVMSTLQFNGISAFLVPILQVCYPALIVLSVINILHRLFGFKPIKLFFYGTLFTTILLALM